MVREDAADSFLEAVTKQHLLELRRFPKNMIKNLAKKALVASGVLRLAGRFRSKSAAILMYHSVVDDPRKVADSLGGIIHSTEVFRAQMEFLARQFQPVDLNRVAAFVQG